jgi:ABC-type amino acid transport substrate-binding protein
MPDQPIPSVSDEPESTGTVTGPLTTAPTPIATGLTPTSIAPPFTPDQPTTQKKSSQRWLIPVIVVVALAGLIGAYFYLTTLFQNKVTSDHAEHMAMSPSLHEIMHVRQKLLVGTENTYQPMEFLDSQSKDLTGFDIDLAKEIAKELNVPVEFAMINFDSVFATKNLGSQNVLTNGKVDMLIDSVTITSERQKSYLFSKPYLNVGQVALTKEANADIHTAADLQNKRIAVETSTSNETLALTYTANENVVRVADFPSAAQAVLDGQADAMLTDLTNAKGITITHPGLKIATDPLTDESYGIVISKDKADLLTQVNLILDSLRQSGVLEQLKQKWLE